MDYPKYIAALVEFTSSHKLLPLADLLSEALFGGAKFGGLDDFVRDEVPAVYLLRHVLGLRAVLSGQEGDDHGYVLDMNTESSSMPWEDIPEEVHPTLMIDISSAMVVQLSRIHGIYNVTEGFIQ